MAANCRPNAAFAALAAALALAACGREAIVDKPPEAGDEAVAKVGDRTVWASDVKREAVAQGVIGEGEPLDASSDRFRQVLDDVIDQKLLAAEAVKRKLDAQPDAQRRLAAARERILSAMLVENSVERVVNENAIRGLYQELQRSARPGEEFRARQIVVASEADAQAIQKLLSSGATFESLALTRSTDAATRFNGGDLGYFTTDIMPETYEAALEGAKAGDLVGPFQTDGGWVLLKVEDRRREEPITMEAARPQIVRLLSYAEVRDLLETLRKDAKINVLVPETAASRREPASAPGAARAAQTPAAPSPVGKK